MSRQFTGEQFTGVIHLGNSRTKLNFLFCVHVCIKKKFVKSVHFFKKASNFWVRLNVLIFYPSPRMICSYPVLISKSLILNSDFHIS